MNFRTYLSCSTKRLAEQLFIYRELNDSMPSASHPVSLEIACELLRNDESLLPATKREILGFVKNWEAEFKDYFKFTAIEEQDAVMTLRGLYESPELMAVFQQERKAEARGRNRSIPLHAALIATLSSKADARSDEITKELARRDARAKELFRSLSSVRLKKPKQELVRQFLVKLFSRDSSHYDENFMNSKGGLNISAIQRALQRDRIRVDRSVIERALKNIEKLYAQRNSKSDWAA